MNSGTPAEALLVADTLLTVGEAPLWHRKEKRLYWLDIPAGRVYYYSPETGTHDLAFEGDPVGGFTIQSDGSLLLFMDHGAIRRLGDGKVTTLIEEIPEERNTRFNDVISDPVGRVFCGTMGTNQAAGRLYRLDTDGSLTVVLEGVGISNGMGFTPGQDGMYYTDSSKGEIYLFDYNIESGELTNRRIFVRVPPQEGEPDGLTVDAEGCVWSARWNGSCLVRFDTEGRELFRLKLPAKKVSCLTFGGEDYRDIYISTAGGENRPEEGPGAGALFCVNLGIPGKPEFESRVQMPSDRR